MNKEFITNGFESDRYLKATTLVQRFESEVTEAINQVCREIIEAHPELFDEDVDLREKVLAAQASRTLATIRTEFAMQFENEEGDTPKLNIALEWVEPEQQGEESASDGSLCYVLYKIQHGSESRYEDVRQHAETRDDWSELRFGADQWHHHAKHAPGIVYVPVAGGPEFADGLRTLRQHFAEAYAPKLTSRR